MSTTRMHRDRSVVLHSHADKEHEEARAAAKGIVNRVDLHNCELAHQAHFKLELSLTNMRSSRWVWIRKRTNLAKVSLPSSTSVKITGCFLSYLIVSSTTTSVPIVMPSSEYS